MVLATKLNNLHTPRLLSQAVLQLCSVMQRSVAMAFVESDGSYICKLCYARHLPCVAQLGSKRNFASPRIWFECPSLETVAGCKSMRCYLTRRVHCMAFLEGHHSSSSSVSSSSSSVGGGGEGFLAGPLLRVPALPNGRARGGGGPSNDEPASFVGCATVELDLSVSADPPLRLLSEASASDSVSASDRSGVAGPGTSSSSFCSSTFASSISIWSLSESSSGAAFAARVGALRLEVRDGPALRGVSVLANCMASARSHRVSP